MTNEIENRTLPATELRVAGDGRTIAGYAAVFGSDSLDMGYTETLRRGCFADSLKRDHVKNPVLALWNHNSDMPLGTTANGSLKLEEDNRGLKFTIKPGKTSYARDARESIAAGLVQGCSFGFTILKDAWTDGGSRREIITADLKEVSPCVFPAFPQTEVQLRNNRRLKMESQKEQAQLLFRQAEELHENLTDKNLDDYRYHCDEFDRLAPGLRWPTFRESGFEGVNRELSKSEGPIIMPLIYGDESEKRAARSAEKGPFRDFGEQLMAIRAAGIPGGQADERLYKIRAATGLNEGISSDGGFLLQDQFSNEIFRAAFGDDSIIPRCRKISISTGANGLTLPAVDESSRADGSRWGGVQSYWAGEAAEYTASKPKFRQMSLKLHKLTGLCYATDELISDTAALATVIKDSFADELKFKLNDAILNGLGNGMPQGILNSDALVTASKETGQAASTVVWENVLSVWERMPYRNRGNAVWLIHQSVEPQLYSMSLTSGTSGIPVFMPAGGASNAPYSTLFSRPIIPVESCAQLGTVGDIILADLSQYVLIDKDPKYDSSIHVRFEYGEEAFRFQYRVDGQSLWSAPMTPFKGSDTLSPFVALETRS